MGTILGDLFKKVGGGIGKVFDGDIVDGIGDVLGGAGDAVSRTWNGALNLLGLGEEELSPGTKLVLCEVAMLAKVAKSDKRVDKAEIGFMQALLDDWGFEGEARNALQAFFNEQKKNVDDIGNWACDAFQAAVQIDSSDEDGNVDIRIEIYKHLFLMALADGELDDAEIMILRTIPEPLGLRREVFDFIVNELAEGAGGPNDDAALSEAYATLGVSPDASDAEVRTAWKKKLAVFHPDKIEGKDLDPEWVALANEKSAQINQAYETIKAARR